MSDGGGGGDALGNRRRDGDGDGDDDAPDLLLRCGGGRQGDLLLLLRVEREQPREHARRAPHRAPLAAAFRPGPFAERGCREIERCQTVAVVVAGGAERVSDVMLLSAFDSGPSRGVGEITGSLRKS